MFTCVATYAAIYSKKACIMVVHTSFTIQLLDDRPCLTSPYTKTIQRYHPDKHNDKYLRQLNMWNAHFAHLCHNPETRSSDVSRSNAIFIHLANMLNPKCHKLEATLFYMFANKAHMLCDWDAFKLWAHAGNGVLGLYLLTVRIVVSKIYVRWDRHVLSDAIESVFRNNAFGLVLLVCVGNFYITTACTVGNLIVWRGVYMCRENFADFSDCNSTFFELCAYGKCAILIWILPK